MPGRLPPSLPNLSLSGPPWHYWRAGHPGIREMSMARGPMLALPLHFHQEDQLAFILSGCRHFIIMGRRMTLPAGMALLIPAGTPHLSHDEPPRSPGAAETSCLNLYLDPAFPADRASCASLLHHVLGQRPAHVHIAPPPVLPLPLREGLPAGSIQALARQAHMSREAFSRRFQRQYGLAPQSFRLLWQLNQAKMQLRAGAGSLHAAMEAGFSDQSHMGRLFRRTFGTTPGRYRSSSLPG